MTVTGHSYALLADGTTAEIRPAGPDDLDAVTRFHQDMSPDNLYLRFFSLSKRAGEQEARRVCGRPTPAMPPCSRCSARGWSAWPATS